jgi:hypothetical protein
MIYLLLLHFDDVHYGHDTLTSRRTCSVICNFRHDDVFIVKYDDGRIRLAVCDCLSFFFPSSSTTTSLSRQDYHCGEDAQASILRNLIERDFHGSIN